MAIKNKTGSMPPAHESGDLIPWTDPSGHVVYMTKAQDKVKKQLAADLAAQGREPSGWHPSTAAELEAADARKAELDAAD